MITITYHDMNPSIPTAFIALSMAVLGVLFTLELICPPLVAFFTKDKRNKKEPFSPDLSIIIPVKNEGLILERTLTSWLGTSYKGKLEILVVDSGSTDSTREIAAKYAHKHSNVFYLEAPGENKLNTLLAGIKKSRHEYLVISDADRLPDPHVLDQLTPFMRDNEIGAVFGSAKIIKNKSLFQQIMTLEHINVMVDFMFYSFVDSVPFLFVHTCILRKKALTPLNGQGFIADDVYLATILRKNGYKAIYIPDIVVGVEQVIQWKEMIGKRMRTSQGSVEIARTNYLHTAFSSSYGLFGLVVLPFRQATTFFLNSLTVVMLITSLIAVVSGAVSASLVLYGWLYLWVIISVGHSIRYIVFLKRFPFNTESVSLLAFLIYPAYYFLIRKVLSGYTFLSYFFGKRYLWVRSTTDRT